MRVFVSRTPTARTRAIMSTTTTRHLSPLRLSLGRRRPYATRTLALQLRTLASDATTPTRSGDERTGGDHHHTTAEAFEFVPVARGLSDGARKGIALWLFGCAATVLCLVIVGGVTRLTESGLSIVEWKPVAGVVWPRDENEWEEEFAKYKQFPEYEQMNSTMELAEFKRIFFWEWAHRMLGRTVGAMVALPLGVLAARGIVRGALLRRLGGVTALIGFQGALGWYMVSSGLDKSIVETPTLEEEPDTDAVVRVSHYRLAAHFTTAVATYSALLWTGMDMIRPRCTPSADRIAKLGSALSRTVAASALAGLRLKGPVTGVAHMALLTMLSGALVAGLDAGMLYNEFPKMGDGLVPEEALDLKPVPRNFVENPATVQFEHRILGVSTLAAATGVFAMARQGHWQALPARARLPLNLVFLTAWAQASLGVSTLVHGVPVHLAASHQAGSLTLLSMSLWAVHSLKRFPVVL